MRYRVRALEGAVLRELTIDAAGRDDVERALAQQGLQLVSAHKDNALSLGARRSKFSVALFTQELVALLEAGLSLIEAIETLCEKSRDPVTQQVLGRLTEALYQGLPLSQAMAAQPDCFSSLYIATVASAERTGHLAEALRRHHHYTTRIAAARKKLVNALIYPLVIVSIGAAILLFLLFYVIPKFSKIYQGIHDLPAGARLLLWWGNLVEHDGGAMLCAVIVAIAGAVFAVRTDRIRARLVELFWNLPRVNAYRRIFALARFYRTVGLLLAGGMPAVAALELASQLLHRSIRPALASAVQAVREGKPLSVALPQHRLTTPVAERLLRVGEQSGELAAMAEKIAAFCDEEVDKGIDLFTRLFEPLLMLILGVLIGAIVFFLYMPIFELAGGIG